MKHFCMALVAMLVLGGTLAPAAGPSNQDSLYSQQPPLSIATSPVTPTPEMWFYQQYVNQYQDPQTMVRKNAEYAASQRQARLAARRWFGFSNLRPTTNIDFLHSPAPSPVWSSRSANYPFRWSTAPFTTLVLRRESLPTY